MIAPKQVAIVVVVSGILSLAVRQLARRSNTQVHRINQRGGPARRSGPGSAAQPSSDNESQLERNPTE